MELPPNAFGWMFDSRLGPRGSLIPRWLLLRALGAIYFSAFLALVYQIRGLNGPQGILPAGDTLAALAQSLGHPSALARFWNAPTLFWFSSSSHTLLLVTWIGLAASVAAFFNLWPRASFAVCLVCFLSFAAAAGDFSGYQSDGMLLEAGFLSLFFAPPGLRPGWGASHPGPRAAWLLLQWEWFRIYFESGLVKLGSGDTQWRHLTAMIGYYQNSPLPTWIGWYVAHLPRWFQVASAGGTLLMELGIVLLVFLPRRWRLLCFLIVTPWEVGVILTGNYAFLNYLVLSLGVLLLDDRTLRRFVPARFRPTHSTTPEPGNQRLLRTARIGIAALLLTWVAYATAAELLLIVMPGAPLPVTPITALEPFRIANQYGLFAVMTRGRYEIEFQGSNDGQHWTPYLYRFKPQALNQRPGLYAPYQPRFDWNLWFASLGSWQQNDIVPLTQLRLLQGDPAVLALFRGNPFSQSPPKYVRTVLWQYWFTSMQEKRANGNWWRRQLMGEYSPTLELGGDGSSVIDVNDPPELPPHD